MRNRLVLAAIAAAALAPSAAFADAAGNISGSAPPLNTGADTYQHVCQGCHMANGQGAMGAGAQFPALAGNPKLASGGYPAYVIMNGYGGMPFFSDTLDNKQIADVVNYIRTHFGNHYTDAVTPADIQPLRANAPASEKE